MYDCCYCSGRDSFIAVIDCLPSSPLSILVSLPFCKMWHTHFCNLSVCTSHFFIIPRSIDSSASSSAHAATRPLTPWQPSATWRQAGSALSADRGALQQLLSRQEKVKAADSGGGKKTDHFIYHSYLMRRDQTSVCMIEDVHRLLQYYINQISDNPFILI